MINNFNSLAELLMNIFLSADESKKDKDSEPGTSETAREFKKQLMMEYLPIDADHIEELANIARSIGNEIKMATTNKQENMLNDQESGFES
jgi:hypothetical protein